ncbi:MAG: DNA alkylation repair protein [Nocardioides sp.]|nr:DNA alkylation repair protein [Nocardioides sp.]
MRSALAGAGDPVRAEGQQRYMKSAMPYRGLTSPELRLLLRPLLRAYEPGSRADWESTVLDLWDRATHREEWYAALAVARHRSARAWLDPESLPLWRHLVVTGAWWDVVDETATHLVRDTLAGHPGVVTPVIDAWSVDDDVWLRRTSVICQVGRGADTDRDLLLRSVEANLEDPSFWLRKGIGWGLRDYARTDPDWVWAQVDRLGDRLSRLSRKEATKHRPVDG